MQFDLQGTDPRFAPLRRLLTEDGHSLGSGGIVIAPPAKRTGLQYYVNQKFTERNAALTAEAACALLLEKSRAALMGQRVLVVGFGRIGSRLARKLHGLGAEVRVAARRAEVRAQAASEGLQAVDITQIDGTYDAVVNTVPAPVLHGDYGGALCLDLASAPGGWADETRVLTAPGLPARYAPEQAALIMRDAIYETVREDDMEKLKLGLALTGSYCSFSKLFAVLEDLCGEFEVQPIFSENAGKDSRFGLASDWRQALEEAAGRPIVDSIAQAEPLGPSNALDVLAIVPCTGNTLAKLAHGITDTAVTMAAKGHLRNGKPLVLGISTNDGLAASAENIGKLLARKNVYFVPFSQDDPEKKPYSLSCDYSKIAATIYAAAEHEQIQPIIK